MKKMLLGLSSVLLIVSSVMGMKSTDETPHKMKHSSSSPVLSKTPKIEVRPRSKSLPAKLLPSSTSQDLIFKEVTMPQCLCDHDENDAVRLVMAEFQKIQGTHPNQFGELLVSLSSLMEDIFIRENLIEVIGDKIECLDHVLSCLRERLIEQSVGSPETVIELLCGISSEEEAARESILYKGTPVSAEVFSLVKLYISALCTFTSQDGSVEETSPILGSIMKELRTKTIPTKFYFSWAIEHAIKNTALLSMFSSHPEARL